MSDTASASGSSTQLVHVGTPPANNNLESLCNNQQVKTFLIAFHNFDGTQDGHNLRSESIPAFGRKWSILVSKYGANFIIVFYLDYTGPLDPMTVRLEVGTWYPERANMGRSKLKSLTYSFGHQNRSLRWDHLERRSDFELVDGALVLKVVMSADQPRANSSPVSNEFIPANPFLGNVLKEYGNEETSDVTIEVGGEAEETGTGRRKRAKRARTDSTAFHVHQFVLRCNAPTLAEMCKPRNEPVQINGVSPETFRHLLYYCYGGKISDEDLQESAKEIIDAADRFGVANLKLEAEACLVQSMSFTLDNILDNLLYADSKNCALLLEKAMDFVVQKRFDIIGKISLDNLPGTMMNDLLTAMTQGPSEKDKPDDIEFMRVSELRKQLHAKGLCVDGSRKAMIALLKENS